MPGFIEGHGHFTGLGDSKLNLELLNTKSWDEIVHMVALAAEKAKPGEWIIGRGWHQEKWSVDADSRTSRAFRRTSRSTRCRRTIP